MKNSGGTYLPLISVEKCQGWRRLQYGKRPDVSSPTPARTKRLNGQQVLPAHWFTLNVSSDARKLTLDLFNKNINLVPIQSLAPKMTLLELKILHTSDFDADLAPFRDIWKLWPQLVGLKINVKAQYSNRNYDADFCGIWKEEAQILREKDEEYLRSLHIVPVRPSVLTMTS